MVNRRCGRDLGEKILQESYTRSLEGTLKGEPETLEAAAERVEAVLLEAAQLVAAEGLLAGHLKALLQAEDCLCSLSVTEPGRCDRTIRGTARGNRTWHLTVNLISALPPTKDPEATVQALFE